PGNPVSRDIDAATDPHLLVPENMVEEAFQGGNPSRPADQASVQPDGEHLRCIEPTGISFAIQRVEGIAHIVEELRARVEALHACEAHVIAVKCVRHYEVLYRTAVRSDVSPIGQVVSI